MSRAASAKAPPVSRMRFRSVPPPPPPPPQIQRAQRQHGGEQDDAHDAEVDEQAHAHAAEDESAQRVAPESAVDEVERDHEHREEGDVLRIEEGVRVDARMEQEQHRGDERQRPAPEHAQDEQVAEDAADEEEQMREEVPAEKDVTAVLQADDAFQQKDERRLEGRAVVPVRGNEQLPEGALAVSREVVQRHVPDHALGLRVHPGAVVFERECAGEQEERAHERERPMGSSPSAERKCDAHADTFMRTARESSSRALTPRRGGGTPPSTACPSRRTGPCARWRWDSPADAPRPRSFRRGAPRASPA